MTPDDVGYYDPIEVWPENWQAVQLFVRVGTQWRVGAGGASGLDYNILFRLMDRMQLDPDEWDFLLEDIRTLESAALVAMRYDDEKK